MRFVAGYVSMMVFIIDIDRFTLLVATWVIRARWREIQRFVWDFKAILLGFSKPILPELIYLTLFL